VLPLTTTSKEGRTTWRGTLSLSLTSPPSLPPHCSLAVPCPPTFSCPHPCRFWWHPVAVVVVVEAVRGGGSGNGLWRSKSGLGLWWLSRRFEDVAVVVKELIAHRHGQTPDTEDNQLSSRPAACPVKSYGGYTATSCLSQRLNVTLSSFTPHSSDLLHFLNG
jgi:hypothetical protein